MTLISDTAGLQAFCADLRETEFVAVDTEFIRERTYWPKLCLVQIAGPTDAVAIDPLADGIDLQPLFELLNDAPVLKVFHSARQDIEIFHHMSDRVPTPLFDTQLAAMVCGFGDQVGLETLISKMSGHQLDKSSRFTDWARRPLSQRQLDYAIADVALLREPFERLRDQLKQNGRERWLQEDVAGLTNPATYRPEPLQAWQRLKPRSTDARFLAILQAVAAWREREAIARDVPRNRVLRDDALLELAAHPPETAADLSRRRAISNGFSNSAAAEELLAAVAHGFGLPRDQAPSRTRPASQRNSAGSLSDLLKVLLKFKCTQHHVAQRLVASAGDVERIAAEDDAPVPALKGWRREVFGEDALRLKRGEIALAIADKKVEVRSIGQDAPDQPLQEPQPGRLVSPAAMDD